MISFSIGVDKNKAIWNQEKYYVFTDDKNTQKKQDLQSKLDEQYNIVILLTVDVVSLLTILGIETRTLCMLDMH